MGSVHVQAIAIAVITLLALGGRASAQEESAVGLLNSLEVQQSVARAEPSDHVRLAAHFSVLADRYAADAKRHLSMAQHFVANPSRSPRPGTSGHFKRLGRREMESSATLRELAAYHENLAGGTPAVLPRHSARFQGGAGAPEPTDQQLDALAAKATTATEHRLIEERFRALAERHVNEARTHTRWAQAHLGTRIAHLAVHHRQRARVARAAAEEAAAAAERHRDLASTVR